MRHPQSDCAIDDPFVGEPVQKSQECVMNDRPVRVEGFFRHYGEHVGAVQEDLQYIRLVFHQSCGAGQLDRSFWFHRWEITRSDARPQELRDSLPGLRVEVAQDLGHQLKSSVTAKL